MSGPIRNMVSSATTYYRGYGFVVTTVGTFNTLRWDGRQNSNAPVHLLERTEHPAIQLFGKNDLQVVVQGEVTRLFVNGPRSGKSPIATIPQDESALLWKTYNK